MWHIIAVDLCIITFISSILATYCLNRMQELFFMTDTENQINELENAMLLIIKKFFMLLNTISKESSYS